jgi:F-type H+-transporting ATPase subunit b
MTRTLRLSLVALAVGPAPAVAAQEGGGLLTVDGGLMFWTLLVFAALFFVLKRYAWPVLLGAVEERERKITEQLAEAERHRTDAAALLEEQRKLLADARTEGQELIVKARSAGEKEREHILERARGEQEALLERARREIVAERERAVLALRREAVDLSLAAAGRLLEESVDNATNRRLVEGYLAAVEQQQ